MGVAGTAPKVQGVGGLKSADCRPANWRPAAARGSPVRGSPTSMPRMVVGDPEPTPQRQKLPNTPNTMRPWAIPSLAAKPPKAETETKTRYAK